MLPFPDVVNFFPHELPSLGGRGFAFSSVFTSPLHGLFFRHLNLLTVSPPAESSAQVEAQPIGKRM